MHPSVAGEPRAAQVVATSGQEVEWNGQSWKVDGKARLLHSPGRLTAWPQACRFKVPANLILVEPRDDGVSAVPIGPVVLVSPDRIIGQRSGPVLPGLGSPNAVGPSRLRPPRGGTIGWRPGAISGRSRTPDPPRTVKARGSCDLASVDQPRPMTNRRSTSR